MTRSISDQLHRNELEGTGPPNRLNWLWSVKHTLGVATVPLSAHVQHMKGSVCGSRKINTKPELYPGGIEAMRSRN